MIKPDVPCVPLYHSFDSRRKITQRTKLRHGCSNLKADLYQDGVSMDSSCSCGNDFEFVFSLNTFLMKGRDAFSEVHCNSFLQLVDS